MAPSTSLERVRALRVRGVLRGYHGWSYPTSAQRWVSSRTRYRMATGCVVLLRPVGRVDADIDRHLAAPSRVRPARNQRS
ncbi:MAG: hypothetical protein ACR2GE_06600 [Pseudonocardia sp.]